MGVTGARDKPSELAAPLVARTKAATGLPVGVGLGISNADQAAGVAAFADAHVRVTKSVARGKTRVAIEALAEADRAGEIARMLAGAAPSPQAAAHADEMLRAARQD